ncbi:hypothetical protein N7466_004864 [Penicillium verhagenii]|uniref:uncharacterized protein n=1 Tax=Penicillium verhagenii TaxID=1562060 RepID=UPI002545AE69|nr:uncharacterized protein N7466_004864 [Penicillium verhagenii]KAJ5935317.1 hypothetical protein N7466_004864 [Penicillium verhagenii]
MRFSTISTGLLMAGAAIATPTQKRTDIDLDLALGLDLDLTTVPVVNVVTAIADKIEVDADIKINAAAVKALVDVNLNLGGLLSCVVNELPADVTARLFIGGTSSTGSGPSTIRVTRTTYATPTAGCAAVQKRDVAVAAGVEVGVDVDVEVDVELLVKLPIINLITVLVQRVSVDVDVSVLYASLKVLAEVDLQAILTCLVAKLDIGVAVSASA